MESQDSFLAWSDGLPTKKEAPSYRRLPWELLLL
jgi:hypothetical protein